MWFSRLVPTLPVLSTAHSIIFDAWLSAKTTLPLNGRLSVCLGHPLFSLALMLTAVRNVDDATRPKCRPGIPDSGGRDQPRCSWP